MRGSMLNQFKEKIAGYNFEPSANRSFLGRTALELPEEKKGRALVKLEDIDVMQLYMPVDGSSDLEYSANLKEKVRRIAEASSEERAPQIQILPEELTASMLPQFQGYSCSATQIPIGIDTEELRVQHLQLEDNIMLIIGESQSGRTNLLRHALHACKDIPCYLFDAKNAGLRAYAECENIFYAQSANDSERLLDNLAEKLRQYEEAYQQEAERGVTMQEYIRVKAPMYILIDVVQDLVSRVEEEEKLDILAQAAEMGIPILVTSDERLRGRGNDFLRMLADAKRGIVLGNIRNQSVFSYTGIREDNNQVDIGYIVERSGILRIKLAYAHEKK